MTNEEKILEMLEGMQAEINGIKAELQRLDAKVSGLTKDEASTRQTVSDICAWLQNFRECISVSPRQRMQARKEQKT